MNPTTQIAARSLTALTLGFGSAHVFAQEPTPVPPTLVQPAETPPAASSSLLISPTALATSAHVAIEPHELRKVSMFAIAPVSARIFHEHDLVQIIVRETVSAKSKHELETDKKVGIKGTVSQWPDLQLENLLNGFLHAGSTESLPQIDAKITKEFEGEGEYERRDDFSARLTAEVLQILPNGNMILESRTRMTQDDEEFILKVTGICRPDDVTPANTVLSNQLHDLKVEKINRGALKDASQKGVFTKVLDALFAF
jgi:flagellar L-ring protein precursor FlgH